MGRDGSKPGDKDAPLLPPPPTVSRRPGPSAPGSSTSDDAFEEIAPWSDEEEVLELSADSEILEDEWSDGDPEEAAHGSGSADILEVDPELLEDLDTGQQEVSEVPSEKPPRPETPVADSESEDEVRSSVSAGPHVHEPGWSTGPRLRTRSVHPWIQWVRDVHPRTFALVGAGAALLIVFANLMLREEAPEDAPLADRDADLQRSARASDRPSESQRHGGAAHSESKPKPASGEGDHVVSDEASQDRSTPPPAGAVDSEPQEVASSDQAGQEAEGELPAEALAAAGQEGPVADEEDSRAASKPAAASSPNEGMADGDAVPTETALDLLKQARAAERAGQHGQAYDLAARSHRAQSSYEALEIMGRAACRLDDRKKLRAALRELPLKKRLELREDCRAAG